MLTITAKNISFYRESKVILQNINFDVCSGKLIWIKGANGSGKTTLLKILAGIILKFSGIVQFSENRITRNKSQYLEEITYIGHSAASWQEKTVIQNLKFWAKIRKTELLLDAALHFFDLYRVKNMQLYKLSSGWKKRVELAKLMIFNSKIWLLDEIFTNLDKDAKNILWNLMKSRLELGGIVFISSHEDLPVNSDIIQELILPTK